ncbi:MAG TPA: hypothetical protein VMW16_08180 [Sedimentisphaerales bacterium]|nr:hypothetical protein [Sedimentisphaerales bacterium]
MDREDFCQSCGQKSRCQEVYQRLGKAERPPIALDAVLALLLPIIVFICSLAVCQKALAGVIHAKQLQTALGVLTALSVTFIWVLITKAIDKQRRRHKCC